MQRGLERNYQYGQDAFADGAKRPIAVDKDFFIDDKLFWSLQCVGFDQHRRFTMDPSFHFRVLEHYLSEANHKERNRIGAQVQR